MKKLISILLTALLLLSVVPAVSAADSKTSTVSSELQDLPDDFASAVNEYIPLLYKKDYPTFTNDNLDGLEFYKITEDYVVFRIIGLNDYKAKQLIDGYLFTAPTYFGSTSLNPCGYCVYSGGVVYPIGNNTVKNNIISIPELAEIIPNTVFLDEENLVSYFKEYGVDVSWVKIVAVNQGHMICYAGSGTATDCDETLEFREYSFHITKAQSPDALGLYMVDVSRVAPFSKKSEVSYDYYRLAEYIRKAEAEGMQFGFAVSHKFGEEAEACIEVMNANNNYPFTVTGFGKLKNHNYYAIATGSAGLTCLDYYVKLGSWWFRSAGQNAPYDLGIYIVDVENNKLYTLDKALDDGVISEDDIDDVIEKIGTSGSGWNVVKLTEIEKKFLEYKYGEGSYLFGEGSRKHVYGETCKERGEFDGYVIVTDNSSFEVLLGDYIVSYERYHGEPYLYNDGKFTTLAQAYEEGILNDNNLADFLNYLEENGIAKVRTRDRLEIAVLDRLNEEGNSFITAKCDKLCDVGNGFSLYNAVAGRETYKEIIGDYTVSSALCGAHAMIVKGDHAYMLKEACDQNLVNIEDVYNAYKGKPYQLSPFTFTKSRHNYHAFIDYVLDKNQGAVKKDIVVDRYDELANGAVLVDYYVKSKCIDYTYKAFLIDKYAYTPRGNPLKIFDGKEMYEISEAYDKGVIDKPELEQIANQLSDFNESALSCKAGYSSKYLNFGNVDFTAKHFTSSDSKVVMIKSGKMIALTKGTATLTYNKSGSKNTYVKVAVKNNPSLSRTSVTVRKGKTVSVKISGKAAEINNVYKNTKYAKVISPNSAKTVKIRGLKKGKTTLKITVNGVWLKLKVKVK